MGMSNREGTLDWLYRLRSEIYVYMPEEWLIPMNNALDVAIDTVKREEMLEDWTKKCRKFEADYENRLKSDLAAMLTEIQLEIEELPTNRIAITDSSGFICYGYSYDEPSAKDASNLIQQKINSLKGEQE